MIGSSRVDIPMDDFVILVADLLYCSQKVELVSHIYSLFFRSLIVILHRTVFDTKVYYNSKPFTADLVVCLTRMDLMLLGQAYHRIGSLWYIVLHTSVFCKLSSFELTMFTSCYLLLIVINVQWENYCRCLSHACVSWLLTSEYFVENSLRQRLMVLAW